MSTRPPILKNIFVVATLTLLAASGATGAQGAVGMQLSAKATQQLGHRLHRDLIAEYKHLRGAGMIVYRKHYPDVSAVVARYIPPGTSFQDAIAILDAAGRWHRKHPPETPPLEPDSHGNVVVRILLPTSIFEFGTGYICVITLVPRVPGDLTTVGEAKAIIFVDYV
jgi:hypothetical protein